jgi:hypothetical protein
LIQHKDADRGQVYPRNIKEDDMSGLFGLHRLLQLIAKLQDWFTEARRWDALAHEIETVSEDERRRILEHLRLCNGNIRRFAAARE